MIEQVKIDQDKKDKQIRVAVYLRVSTEDQVEKFGLDMQREAVYAFIKSKGKLDDGKDRMVLAGEDHIYIDDGVSGTLDIPDRKDFRRLIENIKLAPKDNLPFDAVAVYKVDRLARKLTVLLNIIGIFDKYKIEFLSVNESIDTSTPFGRAILGIMGVIAELEIETTKLRTSGGRIAAKLLGKYGSTPPYGYLKNNLGFLEVLEDEAKHVRDIFRWCVFEGKTTHDIAELLKNHKVVSPMVSTFLHKKKKGQSRKINNDYFWRNETIKGILTNDIYIGNFWFGKTVNKKAVPKEKWQLSNLKMPIIIEEKIFKAAQKNLKDSANKVLLGVKKENDRLYLLSGLIKCGWCQKHNRSTKPHTWDGNKKELKKGSGLYSYYYKCGHKNTGKYDQLCPSIPVPAEQLETYVIAFIKNLLSNPRIAFEHQQRLKSSQLQTKQLKQERNDLIKKLNTIPKRRENLSFQHENNLISNDELITRDKEIIKEDRDLNIRLKDVNKILGVQEMSNGYVKGFTEYANKYASALTDIGNNKDDIYTLVHALIDEIIVYTRPYDPRFDTIAGRRKDNQQIPNSILIKLKLPQDLLNELVSMQIKHLSEFAVRTDMM